MGVLTPRTWRCALWLLHVGEPSACLAPRIPPLAVRPRVDGLFMACSPGGQHAPPMVPSNNRSSASRHRQTQRRPPRGRRRPAADPEAMPSGEARAALAASAGWRCRHRAVAVRRGRMPCTTASGQADGYAYCSQAVELAEKGEFRESTRAPARRCHRAADRQQGPAGQGLSRSVDRLQLCRATGTCRQFPTCR